MIDVYLTIGVIMLFFLAAPFVFHFVEQKLGTKQELETDEE